MANTLIHYLSTAEKFLFSSTKFWSSISTAAIIGAATSFYSTQHYTNHFNNSGIYICSAIIALHFIVFLFNPQTLKNAVAPFFPGSAILWALRFTAVRVGFVLHYLSPQSGIGLIFLICVWIDAIAIDRIIKSSVDTWLIHSMFMAIVTLSIDLYDFTIRHWLIMLLCFPVSFMQFRHEGYKKEETEKKEG